MSNRLCIVGIVAVHTSVCKGSLSEDEVSTYFLSPISVFVVVITVIVVSTCTCIGRGNRQGKVKSMVHHIESGLEREKKHTIEMKSTTQFYKRAKGPHDSEYVLACVSPYLTPIHSEPNQNYIQEESEYVEIT